MTNKTREELRLEQPPFQTMVPTKDLHPDTVDALRGWRPPRGAYVLFEKKQYNVVRDEPHRVGGGLFTLWLEERPEQWGKIPYYKDKGFRVIHYGKFPKLNDPDVARAKKARAHSGKDMINPWDIMAKRLDGEIAGDPHAIEKLAAVENERQALEQKLKAAEEKLAAANSKKGKEQ